MYSLQGSGLRLSPIQPASTATALAASAQGSLAMATRLVVVIDDDESVRESLPDLLRELGYAVHAFASAESFLASELVTEPGCLILDIALPGMKGPELQEELARRGRSIPIVFITANRDSAVRTRLVERGAADVLFKPFSDTALLDAITAALDGTRDSVRGSIE